MPLPRRLQEPGQVAQQQQIGFRRTNRSPISLALGSFAGPPGPRKEFETKVLPEQTKLAWILAIYAVTTTEWGAFESRAGVNIQAIDQAVNPAETPNSPGFRSDSGPFQSAPVINSQAK